MSGEVKRGDEYFSLSGTEYHFMFPGQGGAIGMASSSPFAPKTTTGSRSYADYDAISYLSQDDFSGGIGQEWLKDATRYYDGQNIDTRGGRIAPRPLLHTRGLWVETPEMDLTGTTTWVDVKSGSMIGKACRVYAIHTGNVYRVWLPLRLGIPYDVTVQVKLFDQSGGLPGNELALVNISPRAITAWGNWVEAVFPAPAAVTAGSAYWVAVFQTSGSDGQLEWLSNEHSDVNTVASWNSANWTSNAETFVLGALLNVAASAPDEALTLFTGAGEDLKPRVWGYAGRVLYYLGLEDITPVQNGAGATKVLDADITDAVWYQATADTHPFLYVALGATTNMQAFDGNIGTEEWAEISDHQAQRLAVHDNLLWFCDGDNLVGATNGTDYGDTVMVGSKVHAVDRMCSWQGYLYVGKADGIWRVSYPTGYPGSGTPTCAQVLDFTTQADQPNCVLMQVHQDDLIFSLGQGLMRYTRGNVLTSIGPETGSELLTEHRGQFTAAASSLGTLWVVSEGNVTDYSSVLAYDEGKWHPLFSQKGTILNSIVLEPGYWKDFNAPTLHFSYDLQTANLQMPTTTRRTWTWSGMSYETVTPGVYLSSWFDGNIRVIEKDWIKLMVDVEDYGTGDLGSLDVYWRPNDATAWVQLGTQITAAGLSEFTFPTGSHSREMQTKVVVYGGSDGCLMARAVVVGYMERPDDLRMYTRTYRLASQGTWRNGTPFNSSLAQQVENLRTLRDSAEPLTWYTWYGASRTVHIVDYNGTEMPEDQRDAGDIGEILVTLRLVEV